MANVLFSSDWHLAHATICNFRKEFSSVEAHYEEIKRNYLKTVTKRDKIFLLGDIAFSKDALNDVKEWPGKKVLIVGNHDLERGIVMQDLVDTYDEVYSFYRYKKFWLSHCPIHEEELRSRLNIHGHTHSHLINDPRYLNVCLEHTEYTPIDLNHVRAEFIKRKVLNP